MKEKSYSKNNLLQQNKYSHYNKIYKNKYTKKPEFLNKHLIVSYRLVNKNLSFKRPLYQGNKRRLKILTCKLKNIFHILKLTCICGNTEN